jgi:hypothetical protein
MINALSSTIPTKKKLVDLYEHKGLSAAEIGHLYGCSVSKINYWLHKYHIPKRTISEAVYQRSNPSGDPFLFTPPKQLTDMYLYGLGIGLFWGEGNKRNPTSVRLGNSDPHLITLFITFLRTIYNIDEKRLRFGLQIFSDMNADEALTFWMRHLHVDKSCFQKVVVTPTRGRGSYKNKSRHGVLTVYFNNKKLRDMLCSAVADLQRNTPM